MAELKHYFWLIPVFPLVAAILASLVPMRARRVGAALAIPAMVCSFGLSVISLVSLIRSGTGESMRVVRNFHWFRVAETDLSLGVMLDPLAAVMLVMVTLISLLVFIYSVAYMADDPNRTRFFCFLSLFASAMLGLVLSNSLLLLFMCWEIVGLASYLLIGFWYHRPAASMAARKAFITTRLGDLGLFLGMIWIYSSSGTLLFYDGGKGFLEAEGLGRLTTAVAWGGVGLSSVIGLLFLWGAMGKSGQVPLHVWLPDAMEGPTPVSALIHAATMVAAGIFLLARLFPFLSQGLPDGQAIPLQAAAWIGSITALLAALMALAQTDIKRILAYSTISQLGFMMMGLGVGGASAAVFHLICHAFFKALLFLGAGSVIHAASGQQDIREMGGLRRFLPVTFATYAVGMMALSGVPFFFSGFWSKDELLHEAMVWPVSKGPFILGLVSALLTALYMTRQMFLVFGRPRSQADHDPHESPPLMTGPLVVLAIFTVLLSLIGTPAWPWFKNFLQGERELPNFSRFADAGFLSVAGAATAMVLLGILIGWWWYGRKRYYAEPIEQIFPVGWRALQDRLYFDALYEQTVLRWIPGCARGVRWVETSIIAAAVRTISLLAAGAGWAGRCFDEFIVNAGVDRAARQMRESSETVEIWHRARLQGALKIIGVGFVTIILLMTWGCNR